MFKRQKQVQLEPPQLLSRGKRKKFIQLITQTFPALRNEVLSSRLGVGPKSKLFKTKLPKNVVLYFVSLRVDDVKNDCKNRSDGRRLADVLKDWGARRGQRVYLFFDAKGRGRLFPTVLALWLLNHNWRDNLLSPTLAPLFPQIVADVSPKSLRVNDAKTVFTVTHES